MDASIKPLKSSFLGRHRTVVYFVLGLLALDVAVGRFHDHWQRHSPDDYSARVEACRARKRDFVLLGGSPVAEGLNPDVVGGFDFGKRKLYDGYTLGLSGGTTSDFYHAVLHGCTAPPKVLVYGITASDLNDGRHEPHGPYSLMTCRDVAGWVRLRPEAGEWAVRHFVRGQVEQASSLFRYRHAVRMWAAVEAEGVWPGCCPETRKEAEELKTHAFRLLTTGYAPSRGFELFRFDESKASGLTGPRFTSLHYLHRYRTGSHLKYLDRLAEWCEANQVLFVLLDMPVTADLERLYPAEFAEFRQRLAEFETRRGVIVLRPTREEVGLSDAQFADLIHMNREGAYRLSEWLRDELSELGAPASPRGPAITARAAPPAGEPSGPREKRP